jgi:hypothetical protein
MERDELMRWGRLIETLVELSDVERQVVLQMSTPSSFVPDDLLAQWYGTFRGGRGLSEIGIGEELLAILVDFSRYLDDVTEIVPGDTQDRESYIRHDDVWGAVVDLASFTLERLVEHMAPSEPGFSLS